MKYLLVGVSGYGYTGSGAVIDYLKEREECAHIDVEFNLAYIPHGIQDLEYHLTKGISRYYSCDAAIKDFLHIIRKFNSPRGAYRRNMGEDFLNESKRFVEELSQVIWSGWWSYDGIRMSFLRETWRFRILRRYFLIWEKYNSGKHPLPKNDKMFLAIMPKDFQKKARDYINILIDGFGCDRSKVVIINQPFEPNAPEQSMKYFDDARAIIVDRDPRDIYLFAKYVARHSAAFIPTDKVEDFVQYHKLCRMNSGLEETDKVLRISFEDMVYDYEETTKKISQFLDIPYVTPSKKHFNPDASINNTQLYLRYPEAKSDIAIIERELKDFLYPFYKYEGICGTGAPFVCDSD